MDQPASTAALAEPSTIEVLDPEEGFGVGTGTDILIVDDDENTLIAYQAALESLGRRIVLATSGLDAVAKLLDQDFALVLLDVAMPGMTGIETARLARQRPRNKSLPVIFITGEGSSTQLMVEAYGAGGSDFVTKPVVPEVLRAKAQVFLQLQERTRIIVEYARQLHRAQRQPDVSRERAVFAATERRLKKLQEATTELAKAMTPAEVAMATVRIGVDAVDATAAALWTSEDGTSLVLAAEHGYPLDFLAPWTTIAPGAAIPPMRAFEADEPIWCETEAEYERLSPTTYQYARERQYARAFAALVLRSNGRPSGILVFRYEGDRAFPAEEREFLAALVHACEQAMDRARLFTGELAARRAAEEASRRKDEFLAMLGHELRNPLAAMTSAFDVLKTRDGALPRELTIVDRQLGHLTQLVHDLVDVARVTRGVIVLKREAVHIADAVADALVLAKPVLDQRAHEIVVSVPPALAIDADRERVAQVLSHLLTNAAKYTPPQGRIEVSARRDGDDMEIVIRDDGVGIPASLLPSLFEPFVQGERAIDRKQGGLGIGLTIVRAIVELHGGTVSVHSDGPGTGASFTLRWPTPASDPRPTQPRSAVSSSSFRVLVIEDNLDAAELMTALLGLLGHEVEVTHDGVAGIERARAFRPEIAFIDIGLPLRDGHEVARELRRMPECATTMLVALTGYGQPEDRERALQAGFTYHFVKPIELKTLTSIFEIASASAIGGAVRSRT